MTLPYLIHFASEVRQIIDNDREVELTVPEIVRPNTPMVSSVRSDQAGAAGSALPLELIAAENCRLDQENGILFAETAGYPFLEITEHEKTWTVKARLEPLLTISADAMKARLTLYPSITDRAVPSPTQFYELIQDQDLRYGIDEEAIKVALETAATQPLRQSGIVIAQGILPI
ncbi:MAG TPA: flagellar assembly protein A, partial [Desulforhopalus sp.]|nr:flagellar assembly protein A [Desulforhopalus sp.]